MVGFELWFALLIESEDMGPRIIKTGQGTNRGKLILAAVQNIKKVINKVWLLGFEPRSPRPQRGILTTKLQPLCCLVVTKIIYSYIRLADITHILPDPTPLWQQWAKFYCILLWELVCVLILFGFKQISWVKITPKEVILYKSCVYVK